MFTDTTINNCINELLEKHQKEKEKLEVEQLKEAACLAEELFGLDELERYADEYRKKENLST